MDIWDFLWNISVNYLWFLLALTVHGWGRAWLASRLGDATHRVAGYLSLNPFAHVSFLGSFLVPLGISLYSRKFLPFGWGRSADVNDDHFKHKKLGGILCGLAGSCLNFVIGLLILFLGFVIVKSSPSFRSLCVIGAKVNIAFGLFNLIPIPPLSGAYVLKTIFGIKEKTSAIGSIIGGCVLVALINLPIFIHYFGIAHRFLFNLCFSFCKLFK
jgi:Zn-dependent protease